MGRTRLHEVSDSRQSWQRSEVRIGGKRRRRRRGDSLGAAGEGDGNGRRVGMMGQHADRFYGVGAGTGAGAAMVQGGDAEWRFVAALKENAAARIGVRAGSAVHDLVAVEDLEAVSVEDEVSHEDGVGAEAAFTQGDHGDEEVIFVCFGSKTG